MQRFGSLPFQSWILPDRVEQGYRDTAANIPPTTNPVQQQQGVELDFRDRG